MTAYPSIKFAIDYQLKSLGGPTHVQNVVFGGKRAFSSHLSNYASLNTDTYPPLDIAVRMDKHSPDPKIIRSAADELGYDLVKRSAVQAQGAGADEHVADITQAYATLLSCVVAALRDGRLTPQEKRKIHQGVVDLVKEVHEMDHEIAKTPDGKVTELRRGA